MSVFGHFTEFAAAVLRTLSLKPVIAAASAAGVVESGGEFNEGETVDLAQTKVRVSYYLQTVRHRRTLPLHRHLLLCESLGREFNPCEEPIPFRLVRTRNVRSARGTS